MHLFSGREAEYAIEEDDKYCLHIVNTNPRSIIMVVNVNVSSKIYDTTTAESMCSTTNGSCRLDLLFPNTQFVAVTTPNNVRSLPLKKKAIKLVRFPFPL